MKRHFKITFLIIISLFTSQIFAQSNDEAKLDSQMRKLDALLFEDGFNLCRIEKFEPFIAEDLEFYHDIAGHQNRAEFLKAVKDNICSNQDKKPIRKLVPGSMKIFPLKNNGVLYGAIQNGVHEFYIKEPEKTLYKTGIAKFTHLWLLKDGQWKLKRVLSFDHHPASD
ncbi:nuclear transport factor 2 family protein [Aliikangiella coralliicola]|uniref:Nuclear transport factor 2 family protein n=1 Tax=Aliikangiella coralliicola TaxID=2592383 RepID=A0A545UJC8_9GAMM|nr:nuclear transport factor 2 family protein [Aliikangiella coralliicola]TQV89572.1 nuclear transport factor 2 family protein [Aliikangiella coralliicola]